jgi:hypothetical protein
MSILIQEIVKLDKYGSIRKFIHLLPQTRDLKKYLQLQVYPSQWKRKSSNIRKLAFSLKKNVMFA